MELSIFSAATALIAAAALTWLVLRFFFGTQKATAGAMDASGERQSATITVKGGYSPAVISMRTGTPITLTFDRQETGECTSHVVFADLGLDAMLPGNATTDVELPALPAGEYPFACGMNMVHGLLRVEGEESKDCADKDGLRPRADGSAEAEGVSPSDLRVGAPVVDAAEAERREAAERANEIKALTKLVIVGAVLTLPVFAVTMLHMANPALAPHWMVNPWLQAILITPVMFYCGRPIHTVGFPALAHRSPDMNSLVSLGTSAAYLYSLVTCIAPWVFPEGSREPYFESVGVVITLVLVGRLLETKAREGTGKAVQSLIKLRPRTAHKLNATSADNVDGIEWRNPAHFTDTDIDAIATGDLLVVNNSKVLPARIVGVKQPTGAVCELLLLRQVKGDQWECLAKPGKRMQAGTKVSFGDGTLTAVVDETLEDGNKFVTFYYDTETLYEKLDEFGKMPLPPYITKQLEDQSQYQTVYAKELGSAAAPTAGLHFTPELMDAIRAKGVGIAEVTLHVGLGTFRPVMEDEITDHKMHSEWYSVSEETAQRIRETKAAGHRVIAVGTTSCRTLEAVAAKYGEIKACSGNTSIFLYPGVKFNCIDGLITNFHLPESTLIMLVSALYGYEKTMAAYKVAVEEKYRFFSFGDAMLIL